MGAPLNRSEPSDPAIASRFSYVDSMIEREQVASTPEITSRILEILAPMARRFGRQPPPSSSS